MHRIQLTTLLLTAASLISSGCHQTTGPVNTGALPPAVGTLSPMGQGQTPILGPLGGSTRVTPPGTGSRVAPNNYMGGTAPMGQTSFGLNPNGLAAAPATGVIGSGVQVAGWSETNSVTQAPQATLGSNPSAGTDPRTGGMQVIDLTGAPTPPGYRSVTTPGFTNQFPPAAQANPGFQQGWQQPQVAPQQVIPQQSFQNSGGLQPINTPNPGEIANSLTPISNQFPTASQFQAGPSPIQSVPQTATLPAQAPSTQPVTPNNSAAGQSLPWRRPGTTF